MKNHYTNNSPKNHYTNNFMIIFAAINEINKHKTNIYNQCMYTPIITKNNYLFSSQSIRMSGNSINFYDKKSKKVTSTTKAKQYLI